MCLEKVTLQSHSTARSTAVAVESLKPGETIVSVTAWITALLLSEKGRRCDWCGCSPQEGQSLKKCAGCGSYWYCGSECQLSQWKAHHKLICKTYGRYTASPAYQHLSAEEKVDAILFSHTMAHLHLNQPNPEASLPGPSSSDLSSPYATFRSLMEYRSAGFSPPPICGSKSGASSAIPLSVDSLYSRFGNNNFVLHSHLTPFAHGIFPLASRLFNHSCVPNAVMKYILSPGRPPCMEILAISEIPRNEEITIPYLDPATPLHVRQYQLQSRYGFLCTCPACIFQSGISPISLTSPEEVKTLETLLRKTVQPSGPQSLVLPNRYIFPEISQQLYPLLHESYLPSLSETSSKASHEGAYVLALEAGLTLLSLYSVLYPPNYPQIGSHALELAKTAWNASVAGGVPGTSASACAELARTYLTLARSVLGVLGPEGDPGGPAEEIRILLDLLDE